MCCRMAPAFAVAIVSATWNEQFPCFVGKGPTLAWARRVNQAFELSLRELAGFLDGRRDLDDVVAICANMSLEPAERSAQLVRFVSRFGFERIAAASSHSFRQQMHWFGENILISMMVLAARSHLGVFVVPGIAAALRLGARCGGLKTRRAALLVRPEPPRFSGT
jgi:hypothetical protein